MALDPLDIVVFVQVAEHGGFRAAAEATSLPRTTVNRRVQRLEAGLGVRLINRTTRQMRLTEAGQILLLRARGLRGLLEEAEEAVRGLDGRPRGCLRVATSVAFAFYWLMGVFPSFCEAYPDVTLDLVTGHLPVDLIRANVDVELRLGPLAPSGYFARRLGSFTTHIFAAPSYLEKHGTPTTPGELVRHHALATRQSVAANGHVWRLNREGEEVDCRIRPLVLMDDPTLAVACALNGGGLTMAMDAAMASYVAAGRLVVVLPDWEGTRPDLHAVFPNGPGQPSKVRAFVDFLAQAMASRKGERAAYAPASGRSKKRRA